MFVIFHTNMQCFRSVVIRKIKFDLKEKWKTSDKVLSQLMILSTSLNWYCVKQNRLGTYMYVWIIRACMHDVDQCKSSVTMISPQVDKNIKHCALCRRRQISPWSRGLGKKNVLKTEKYPARTQRLHYRHIPIFKKIIS